MTVPVASFLSDLCLGFAQLLAQDGPFRMASIPGVGVPLYVMSMPDSPVELGSISPYPLSDDPVFGESEVGVQFRFRSGDDPRSVLDIDSAAFDVLAGRWPLTLPTGIRVVRLLPGPAGSLGQDPLHRWGWSRNFTATAFHPTSHRS